MPDRPSPLDALLSSDVDQQQSDAQAPNLEDIAGPQQAPDVGASQAAATPELATQGYQGPRPILMDLVQGLVHPRMQAAGPGQMATPVSRAQTFENFLANFVGALGAGFGASGTGPGSF